MKKQAYILKISERNNKINLKPLSKIYFDIRKRIDLLYL